MVSAPHPRAYRNLYSRLLICVQTLYQNPSLSSLCLLLRHFQYYPKEHRFHQMKERILEYLFICQKSCSYNLVGCFITAMYKARDTGMGSGARGMGGMLYSGDCREAFRGLSPSIPGVLPNIPGNVAKHSGGCRRTSRGMLSSIPGNVLFTLMVESWSKLHP